MRTLLFGNRNESTRRNPAVQYRKQGAQRPCACVAGVRVERWRGVDAFERRLFPAVIL
jgi:hypothetical protein